MVAEDDDQGSKKEKLNQMLGLLFEFIIIMKKDQCFSNPHKY
jgi:hypothetical protein